ELLEQVRKQLISLETWTDRKARLEKAACFTVELGANGEARARHQQDGIVFVLVEPCFGMVERLQRVVGLELPIRPHSSFVPLSFEQLTQLLFGILLLAAGHRRACIRYDDLGVLRQRVGHVLPRSAQRLAVFCRASLL